MRTSRSGSSWTDSTPRVAVLCRRMAAGGGADGCMRAAGGAGRQRVSHERDQLVRQLPRPLEWHVVDGVVEPAYARLRLKLECSIDRGRLVGAHLRCV